MKTANSFRLRLLSRSYCHLCHDMEAAIQPLLAEFGKDVEVLDIDEFPALEELWGEFVPVLLDGDVELSRYILDEARVRSYFSNNLIFP